MKHARDREVWYNQKNVLAVCCLRVPIWRTVYVPLIEPDSITCVECLAILRKRELCKCLGPCTQRSAS
ncbi:MAG: hypothetical protein V4502_06105 [Pseudomonadota bacterium]